MTGTTSMHLSSAPNHQNEGASAYFEHSSAPRVSTEAVITDALRREYPQLHLTVSPRGTCDLLSYASAGHAAAAPIDKETDRMTTLTYRPAMRRLNGENDGLAESVQFGKFLYEWKGKEFVLYIADGRDGSSYYPQVVNQYILSSSVQATQNLLLEAGRWSTDLHNEVWVFDQGFWQKSAELWESVQAAEWENVILSADMKKSLIRDVDNFFNGRETYSKLKVPWKRGVIYYGPPGNGKTISIKAMMHSLYKRKDPVPTLYVKTLSSFAGPEYSIRQIFTQARRYAPCYLIFEDLDSLITPSVRSYFLNEVDGLKNNDGILMVGSTNHLDQLDPGIAKRPSRFDRKYYFPDPNKEERYAYAKFWQRKLEDNKEIEFPDEICDGMAAITDGFSFAYMQEAFIAALLALAAQGAESEDDSPDAYASVDLEKPGFYLISKRPEVSEGSFNSTMHNLRPDWHVYRHPYDLRHVLFLQGSDKSLERLCGTHGTEDVSITLFHGTLDEFHALRYENGKEVLDKFPLWRELRKQVRNLRSEMDRDCTDKDSK